MPPVKPTTTPNDALADMARRIKELESQNAALKEASVKSGKLSLKVSEKGALSVYGMGRFPVTLYRSQWENLLAEASVGAIKEFIKAHESELKTKDDVTKAAGGTATAPAASVAPATPGKAF